jgi:formyltetrahydrofolate deformylase
MAIFGSRYDHCLYDLLLRHRAGELSCEIALIVSNHPDLEPVARQFGIDYHVFPITKANKAEQEERQLALLDSAGADLIVMARYMQILSSGFIGRHPAHYATTDLDEGPIIEQDVIRASHRDSVADLVRKGRDVERNVLARAVRWHLEDRILVYGNKTVVFD